MNIEQTIEITKATLEDIERLAKAASVDKQEEAKDRIAQHAALYGIERSSKKLRSVIAGDSDKPVVFSFGDMRVSSIYRHSTLGTARPSTTEYQYYQTSDSEIRRGQRFMDRFDISRIGVNNTLRLFYPSTVTGTAGLVNEGQAKPLREYTFNTQDFPFQKLAVTDLITHELTIADTRDRVADFLTTALVEHVLDSLNQQFINYLSTNATAFNAAAFANVFHLPSSVDVRWHDLLAAMQIQFFIEFADHILPIEYGNIIMASSYYYLGILRDRVAPGYAHYGDGGVFGNSALRIEDIMHDKNYSGILLTNTQAVRIEVIDEVQVYFERVAESASERNLYRLTAEVYFRFIPAKLPLPAIVSSTPLTDFTILQP
jgi:hypothetical protein